MKKSILHSSRGSKVCYQHLAEAFAQCQNRTAPRHEEVCAHDKSKQGGQSQRTGGPELTVTAKPGLKQLTHFQQCDISSFVRGAESPYDLIAFHTATMSNVNLRLAEDIQTITCFHAKTRQLLSEPKQYPRNPALLNLKSQVALT